ncbi:ERI1 exoribonuclease 3-like isoform X1 [Salvia divinorum]|uniref:ERI1 exoribonuclease 3-like isoform X1 n=1 Tax=Salvia divinorum TaxID=28513 RepID=A0ABD1H934_SALDI
MMISLDRKDAMQSNHETSIKKIQNAGYLCSPSHKKAYFEGFPELHDDAPVQTGSSSGSGSGAVEQDCPLSSEPVEPLEESTKRPLYYHDFGKWSRNPGCNNALMCHLNVVHAHFHPSAMSYRFQRVPAHMMAQSYLHDKQFQDFQYFVVIDFEATCDKERVPYPQEIIEFPSVIVSSITGQLEDSFQTYVRPSCNQHLTDFCKDLTGIQQIQVDHGVSLSEALLSHDKWLENKGIKNANFAIVTWSDWDCQVMLESECRFKQIRKPPYFNRWIDLRVPFREVFGGGRCNLKEAVEKAGLSWQGRAHCGLDDARNTACLLALLMHRGFKFSITNSLTRDEPSMSNAPPEKPVFIAPRAQRQHQNPFCYCGVKSSKGIVRKPGPRQGSIFFGCGNWTAARGALCQYFQWASL